MEGISSQEAKAKRAQLQEELAEAQEDLEGTKRDHYYDLSTEALDEMQDVLKNEFDDKWENLGISLDDIRQLLSDAKDISTQSSSAIVTSLNKLLAFYGVNASNAGITAFAGGARRISSNLVGLSQEHGSELLVTKNGIISHFNPGDGVVPSALTQKLYAMANGQLPIPTSSGAGGTHIEQHYDSLINIEGSADAATVEDLKKLSTELLERSYKYTSQKIHDGYLKSGGRRSI